MTEIKMCIIPSRAFWLALSVGCTFPIKNDIIDTSDPQGEYGSIDTQEVPNCSYDNLLTLIEVRNYEGITLTKAKTGSMAYLWAEVANICDVSIDYQTETSCLVDEWSIEGGGFEPQTYPFICNEGPKQRKLASGQLIRRLVAPLTDLPAGTFNLAVTFGIVQASGDRFIKETTYQVSAED